MKKHTGGWWSFLLAFVMAMMLCACSASGGEEKKGGEQSEADSGEEKKSEEKEKKPELEEQVLYEENGFRITAKSLEFSEFEEYSAASLTLLVENEGTEDMKYFVKAMTVNQYEVDGVISAEKNVPAGKKANEKLNIDGTKLAKTGYELDEIRELEVEFMICRADGETSDVIRTGLIPVKTSVYDQVEDKPAEGGKEIYNEAGVKIQYLEMAEGTEGSPDDFSAEVLIENTSDTPVFCWITGGTIDGTEVDSYNTPHVSAGRKARASVQFFGDEAGKMDIGAINEITVTIHLSEDVETMDEYGYPSRKTIADYQDVTFTVK